MSNYIDRCERCGKPFEDSSERKKITLMRDVGSGFSTDGWSRYICEECAYEVTLDFDAESEGAR